ncbi:DUF4249 domain-containing protein [Flavihumibacter petaseus]|uniref:DUF4249 domain-containing protein n=1 Tax=Flavihumibacter petaseus NBRC 106054 TaxID=1220578 RepID=A0A0E9N5F1_9BACT|nr:DUF4249 domain-containing protein [Flavihumibacter petaseus]GAO44570.1 hypothetical protein FPE01S_03_06080 [Flavihumibacter petaseus NBRC 106054]
MYRGLPICLLALLTFYGCEKAVSFDLDEQPPKLVVDGSIESTKPPMVVLSRSLDYFSEITPEILESSFVHGADITVSNGTLTHRLKEYAVEAPEATVYYYGIDSSDLATAFLGEFGKTYQLQISVEDQRYAATTVIPDLTKRIDSLGWMPSPNNPDTNKVVLLAAVTDPPGFGNYIRYFTSVNHEAYLPGLNSVYDDQIVDGQSYTIEVEKGVNRNEEIDFEDYSFFDRGDTVIVKFANIDKATYDFWRTMEYNYQSIGSPFSSPTKVLGNVSNGALGYFGGYAVQYKSIIIPK